MRVSGFLILFNIFVSPLMAEDCIDFLSEMQALKTNFDQAPEIAFEFHILRELKDLVRENSLEFENLKDLSKAWSSLDPKDRSWPILKNPFGYSSRQWISFFIKDSSLAILQLFEIARLGSVEAPKNSYQSHLARYARKYFYKVSEEISAEIDRDLHELPLAHPSLKKSTADWNRFRIISRYILENIRDWPLMSPSKYYLRYTNIEPPIDPYSLEPADVLNNLGDRDRMSSTVIEIEGLIFLSTDEGTEDGLREFSRWSLDQIFNSQKKARLKLPSYALFLSESFKERYLQQQKIFQRNRDIIVVTE